jgi:hypothetical protein
MMRMSKRDRLLKTAPRELRGFVLEELPQEEEEAAEE